MFGRRKKRIESMIRRQWGCDPRDLPTAYMVENRMKSIRMYQEEYGQDGIDAITWSDLEMDEVFYRINNTRSFVGEQVLYRQLHEPGTGERQQLFSKLVSAFAKDEKRRLVFERKFCGIGKRQSSYFLPLMLKMLDDRGWAELVFYRLLQLLFICAILGAFLFRLPQASFFLILMVSCNLTIYIIKKEKQEYTFYSLYDVSVIVKFCRYFEKNWPLDDVSCAEEIRRDLKKLRRVEKAVGGFSVRKAFELNDPNNFLLDYLFGITLIDLVSYIKLSRAILGNEEAILHLFDLAGTVDSAISCASFQKGMKCGCHPTFTKKEEICCEDLLHPLLRDAVGNDLVLTKNTIITGANASGKSTLMKALAVNVILAQTIDFCTASKFEIPEMDVMSSMAIRDDLISGESYYVREVKYMRRMVKRLESGKMVLFVVDEIMKGTNQRERLAVSEALLHFFSDKTCFIIVATHDHELAERVRDAYKCYYFDCFYDEGTITFDYKIKAGLGGESNAILLLEQFDFPEEVLSDAKEILSHEGDL